VAAFAAAASTAGITSGDIRANDGPSFHTSWHQRTSFAAAAAWQALTPSPLSRTEVGAARVGDRIYVVGGFVPDGGSTGALAAHDISANRWQQLEPLPISVNHPGVAALGGRVYLLGGNSARGPSNRFFSYSPRGDRWRSLPSAPTARAALALVPYAGELYAIGGVSAAGSTGRVEIFNPKRGGWRRSDSMPTPRNHVAGAVLEGRIYVTGGRTGSNLDVVESFDPERERWRAEPALTVPRSGHAAAVTGGRLYVFGGEQLDEGDRTIAEIEALRPGGEWSTSGLPLMRTPRHGLGGAAFAGRLYALEGGPQPGLSFSNALEVLRIR
jgi:N-acetylneuraminic acid mutarotase